MNARARRRCSQRVGLERSPPTTPVVDADRRADADGRDRQGAVARRPHHHHGRADVVADRRRIASSCSRSSASSRSEGIGIIYISHRMEEVLHAGRPHHRPARRPLRRRPRARRGDARQDRRDDGGPRAARGQYFPPSSRRRRRRPVRRTRSWRSTTCSCPARRPASASPPARGEILASPGWSAPAARS